MKKYWKIWWRILKMSLMQSMMYRSDMICGSITSLIYFVIQICLIKLLYVAGGINQIAGFSIDQMYVILALSQIEIFFIFVFVQSNTPMVLNQINNGLLDFFLLKPVNKYFLIMNQKYVAVQSYVIILYLLVFIPYLYSIGAINFTSWQWGWIVFIVLISLVVHAVLLWVAVLLNFFWPNFKTMYMFMNNILDITRYPKQVYPQIIQDVFFYIVPIFFIMNPIYDILAGNWKWVDGVRVLVITFIFVLIFANIFGYGLKRYNSAA